MSAFERVASLFATGSLLLVSSIAVAADRYAVMSAIGDEFTIVTYQPSVGTNLDSNQKQVVPLPDDSFDTVAAMAAAAAIRRTDPDAVAVIVKSPDPSAYLHDGPSFDEAVPSATLVDALRGRLTGIDAQYLLLVTKSKGATRLHFRDDERGEGKLFGIGYYFDRFTRVTQTNSRRQGRGFLSPYAYLTITLIDLQTGRVVRSVPARESASIGSGVSETEMHPWDAVPAEMKVRALNGVIRKAIATAAPDVLKPS